MTGETRDPHDWVETGRFVRAFCAADRSTHSYGWVKSYCEAPTVGIERPDGTWLNWRADLCEPADPSTEEFWDQQSAVERPAASLGWSVSEVGAALTAIASELKRMNDGRDDFHREVLNVFREAKNAGEEE